MVYSQQLNAGTDRRKDMYVMQRVRSPICKTGFFCNVVKGRGHLKWTEHKVQTQVSLAITVIKEHKISALLKLSLTTIKLNYFNLKLFA